MARQTIGIMHPGAMGAAVGAALRISGHTVLWAAAGRSQDTSHRAELADLIAVPSIADLARRAQVLISLCPPHAALDVAREVAAADRPGLYVDANAVAPSTMTEIGRVLDGGRVVDAAVIGPPPWRPDTTVMYLAGAGAGDAAALFSGSPLRTHIVGDGLGQASAVKACFALHSKAAPTIWALIAAAAQGYGVSTAVRQALAEDHIDLDKELDELARRATAKAWRWEGEMTEAGRALADIGLPDGFSAAAAELYRRVAAASGRDAEPVGPTWVDGISRR